ncbi:hypothetical protein KI387_005149, partial [Taxus chinensis]
LRSRSFFSIHGDLDSVENRFGHLQSLIFTNGNKAHASEVLSRTGLEDYFEGVICFETLNSYPKTAENCNDWDTTISVIPKASILCKPSIEAIECALCIANADPQRTIFFDDSPRNVAAGKFAGLHTVLVGNPIRTEGSDFALESIHNIKEAMPEIWKGNEISENVVPSGRVVIIETVVNA